MNMKRCWLVLILLAMALPACFFTRFASSPQATASPMIQQTMPAITTSPQVSPVTTTLPQITPEKTGRESVLDVAYARYPGSVPDSTSLDIYQPAMGENLPVMIFVHGGAWRIGNKKNVDLKPGAFNESGYLFVSINYRMLPEADVPTQAGDVANAIAWIYTHVAEYGGDPQQIFLMGHSAGAHLVSLVGVDPSYLENAGLSLTVVRGVVALDTQAYDVTAKMNNLSGLEGQAYRQAFGSDPAFWKKLSPITYVKAENNIPPFIVAYSGQGATRPEQAESFVEALRQGGVTAELLPATEKTHLTINRQFGEPDDAVTRAVLAFLEKIRRGSWL